jgi:UDP-3-O-[3-hydroxymyristoyl] glucosamine N-acyltransferase
VHSPLPVPVSVNTLAELIDGEVRGDGTRLITRLASLESADARSIVFLSGRRHGRAAAASLAAAVIVSPELESLLSAGVARIVVADPYLAYARLSQWMASQLANAAAALSSIAAQAIDPSAHIADSARIGEGVQIGPGVTIGAGASIGAHCRIAAGCSIGVDVSVGERSVLHPGVTLYAGVRIGQRALIHASTVIGADGFGFAPSPDGWVKIAQLGSVLIGDDVEIGANCAVDRGALDDTIIGNGCKIDNLVQIGHNVRIGEHTAIAGCVGIAGSAVIGRRCMIGGGVGVAGHIEICDGAIIGGMSLVERSVTEPGFYTGAWPLQTHTQWERTAATLKQLPQLRQRLRALASKVGLTKDPE